MGRRTGILESGRVLYLPLGSIRPNPAQPRRIFDPAGLQELADSIRQYGILQPLTVRRKENGYELIAGERRLRAAGMAGLTQAPCLVAAVDEEASGMLALVENLQRRDLDFIEDVRVRSAGSHLRKVGHEHVCRFFEFFLRLHHYHFNFFDI